MSPSNDMNRFLLLPSSVSHDTLHLPPTHSDFPGLPSAPQVICEAEFYTSYAAQPNLFPQLSIQDDRSNVVEDEHLAFQITDVDGL